MDQIKKERIITNSRGIYPIQDTKPKQPEVKSNSYYSAWDCEYSRNYKVVLSSFESNKKRH